MRLFQFLMNRPDSLGTIKAWAAFHRFKHGGSPQGREFGVYLVFRWHEPALRVQDPRSLVRALQAMDFLSRGHLLADLSAIIGSLDIVLGEID
jgi:NADH:ubiquinone oxidoreductase subunit D